MDPFVAEIRIFAFNFAPVGWAQCQGQLLPLAQNTALFSLLGTTYGGNGKSNFALPDLRDRVPMHPGQGPGLSFHGLGEADGAAAVVLAANEMPAHTHQANCNSGNANQRTPAGNYWAQNAGTGLEYSATSSDRMAASAIFPAGGDVPHENCQPYLGLNFCIAMQGVYPPRT